MKAKIENKATSEFFTNVALDSTQKRVLNYKDVYGQLGNAFTNIAETVTKGINDIDDLKLRQFKALADERQNTYLTAMNVTNTQEERDKLTSDYKKSIDLLATDKTILNDRQLNKWNIKYRDMYFKTVDEKHAQETFLGLRRNVRDEGLKSAEQLTNTVSSNDDDFNNVLLQSQAIKNTMKSYMLQKDFDEFDINFTNALYERKAMKDIEAGRAKEVFDDISAGGIKYKVSKTGGEKIKEYANKLYRTQLQNNLAMTVIGKATNNNGEVDYTKASELLLANGKGFEYEDLKGALDIVSLMQSTNEKNKTIRAEQSFMNKYNYGIELKKKGAPITQILDMIHAYDPYLPPRDEQALVTYFTDEATSTGVGPDKGLGTQYSSILQKVVNKEITTESDARLYQARVNGELTESGLDSLKKHIKTIQLPENQAVATDILTKAETLYKSNTNFFTASDSEKAYIKQRLMDNLSSIDQTNAVGRTEIDKLRDLGYLQNMITKYRAEYTGTMEDAQARIDLEDRHTAIKKDIVNQVSDITNKINSGTITEKEFKKSLESIIKINQYKQDKDIMEYYDIDEDINKLTDLYNTVKNNPPKKQLYWISAPEKIKQELNLRAASDVLTPTKAIPKNTRRTLKEPIKSSMSIEEFTKQHIKE